MIFASCVFAWMPGSAPVGSSRPWRHSNQVVIEARRLRADNNLPPLPLYDRQGHISHLNNVILISLDTARTIGDSKGVGAGISGVAINGGSLGRSGGRI
eukprot:scaffold9371_cov211-Amphora_coffeaeformis.AAC.8